MKFKYLAQDSKGKHISNIATAENVGSLVMRLKKEGLLPVKVYEVESTSTQLSARILKLKERVTGKELAVFTRQLAATLSAGLLLTEALDTIADDLENHYFRDVLIKVIEDIRGGADFSNALGKFSKIFPSTYISIIKSGEATGRLDKTLVSLAHYLESSERLREKVKSAVCYPLFVLGFAFFIVFVIVVFLIPKFKGLFDNANAQLPLLTRIVVGISEFVLNHSFLGLGFLVLLGVAGWYSLRFPKVRYTIDVIKFKIPIMGKDIIHKAVVARFCRTLNVLLAGGVGLGAALGIVREVVNHRPMSDAIERIRSRVLGGSSLAEEIKAQKIFPRLVAKMTAVGERTGNLPNMLERTANYYEDELENTLQRLTSLLEPALIMFIGGIVLIVVLALYLPIFKISTAIH